jgi:hypothetical protein
MLEWRDVYEFVFNVYDFIYIIKIFINCLVIYTSISILFVHFEESINLLHYRIAVNGVDLDWGYLNYLAENLKKEFGLVKFINFGV